MAWSPRSSPGGRPPPSARGRRDPAGPERPGGAEGRAGPPGGAEPVERRGRHRCGRAGSGGERRRRWGSRRALGAQRRAGPGPPCRPPAGLSVRAGPRGGRGRSGAALCPGQGTRRPAGRGRGRRCGGGGALCPLADARSQPGSAAREARCVRAGAAGGAGRLPGPACPPQVLLLGTRGVLCCCRCYPAGAAEMAFVASNLIYFLPFRVSDGLLECSRLSLYINLYSLRLSWLRSVAGFQRCVSNWFLSF